MRRKHAIWLTLTCLSLFCVGPVASGQGADATFEDLVVRYEKTGGIAGGTMRLTVFLDGLAIADREMGGMHRHGMAYLDVEEVDALAWAVGDELAKERPAVWDCDVGADFFQYKLASCVLGDYRKLVTCKPDEDLQKLFDRLDSLVIRIVNPQFRPLRGDLEADAVEMELSGLPGIRAYHVRVFPVKKDTPVKKDIVLAVVFSIDDDGILEVRDRFEVSREELRLMRAFLRSFGGADGGTIHDHDVPPWPSSATLQNTRKLPRLRGLRGKGFWVELPEPPLHGIDDEKPKSKKDIVYPIDPPFGIRDEEPSRVKLGGGSPKGRWDDEPSRVEFGGLPKGRWDEEPSRVKLGGGLPKGRWDEEPSGVKLGSDSLKGLWDDFVDRPGIRRPGTIVPYVFTLRSARFGTYMEKEWPASKAPPGLFKAFIRTMKK